MVEVSKRNVVFTEASIVPDLVTHTYNPGTLEAEKEGSEV